MGQNSTEEVRGVSNCRVSAEGSEGVASSDIERRLCSTRYKGWIDNNDDCIKLLIALI